MSVSVEARAPYLDRRVAEERADFANRFRAYDTKANRRILDDLLAAVAAAGRP